MTINLSNPPLLNTLIIQCPPSSQSYTAPPASKSFIMVRIKYKRYVNPWRDIREIKIWAFNMRRNHRNTPWFHAPGLRLHSWMNQENISTSLIKFAWDYFHNTLLCHRINVNNKYVIAHLPLPQSNKSLLTVATPSPKIEVFYRKVLALPERCYWTCNDVALSMELKTLTSSETPLYKGWEHVQETLKFQRQKLRLKWRVWSDATHEKVAERQAIWALWKKRQRPSYSSPIYGDARRWFWWEPSVSAHWYRCPIVLNLNKKAVTRL